MNKILPATMASSPQMTSNMSGGLDIGNLMNIIVNGNLDKSVLPDIKNIANKVMDELNKTMLLRGSNRRADLFQQ
jgi:hypothetical protein